MTREQKKNSNYNIKSDIQAAREYSTVHETTSYVLFTDEKKINKAHEKNEILKKRMKAKKKKMLKMSVMVTLCTI